MVDFPLPLAPTMAVQEPRGRGGAFARMLRGEALE